MFAGLVRLESNTDSTRHPMGKAGGPGAAPGVVSSGGQLSQEAGQEAGVFEVAGTRTGGPLCTPRSALSAPVTAPL
ncbi:hypothetical protein SKAU_G00179480 [Synaphobranchus kaupii]|uniref:Uncharacterized protein n=1 Tax=Synaphobranchus kaupii TaxID=118154 RepID=A0A9Q1FMB7_SYNKA|nr:hypothetical protein SKAU_G00179480 [Synaphobranchus kaupii]